MVEAKAATKKLPVGFEEMSEKFFKQIQSDTALRKGQSMTFRLKNIRWDKVLQKEICPKSVQVPAYCRILDPVTQEPIEIRYIVRQVPESRGAKKDYRVVYGNIKFTRDMAGRITIQGGQVQRNGLKWFLYLCNANHNNIKEPWFNGNPGKTMFVREDIGKEKREKKMLDRLIRTGKQLVDEMSEEEILHVGKHYFPNTWMGMDQEDFEDNLYPVIEKNPEAFINMVESGRSTIMANITDFLLKEVLVVQGNQYSYAGTQEPVFTAQGKEGQTAKDEFCNFLRSGPGAPLLKTLREAAAQPVYSKPKV